ncbi:MAG: SDR family oxidoreductase [Victivallales bacterium]|nr:SDR family oxidoreductase [Victivallales bacterium]
MPQSVLITGAAKRIGRSLALAFAEAGWRVAIHYNQSREEAESLLAQLGGVTAGHAIVQADFSVPSAASEVIPALTRQGFIPDALINSASKYTRLSLADIAPERLASALAVNFQAPFELMRSFRSHVGRGCIINILDQRVAYVDPAAGPYALAKKSLRDATLAAALEWAPDIRVNAIAPGLVLSPPGVPAERLQPLIARIPARRRTTEGDLAAAALFLAASPAITGQILYVDGGLHLLGHAVES